MSMVSDDHQGSNVFCVATNLTFTQRLSEDYMYLCMFPGRYSVRKDVGDVAARPYKCWGVLVT